jgi:hypothetical protein
MTTGAQSDFVARIKALLPNGWFRDSTPVLDAVLSGIGSALASVYGLTQYARLQTRIATATDAFLDLISFDFFGATLPRRSQEGDESFRARVIAGLFPERVTRRGMYRTLLALTGRAPVIFEPARPKDTGAYNTNTLGYGVAGAYGSLALPGQSFITAFRPIGQGIPNVAGYGSPAGGYNTGSRLEYASADMIAGTVTDADIYAARIQS